MASILPSVNHPLPLEFGKVIQSKNPESKLTVVSHYEWIVNGKELAVFFDWIKYGVAGNPWNHITPIAVANCCHAAFRRESKSMIFLSDTPIEMIEIPISGLSASWLKKIGADFEMGKEEFFIHLANDFVQYHRKSWREEL